MRSRIASVLVLGLLLVTTAAVSSSNASATPPKAPRSIKPETCGTWRWPVKTLSDGRAHEVHYTAIKRSIQFLRTVYAPGGLSSDDKRIRKSPEVRTYRIHGDLIEAIREPDHDVHLVVSVRGHPRRSLIVEFPDVSCNGAASSYKKGKIASARKALFADCGDISSSDFTQLNGQATIIGVGFFDESHGASGASPNGIELHPVLSYSGTCSKE